MTPEEKLARKWATALRGADEPVKYFAPLLPPATAFVRMGEALRATSAQVLKDGTHCWCTDRSKAAKDLAHWSFCAKAHAALAAFDAHMKEIDHA